MRLLVIALLVVVPLAAESPWHPLDGLTTAEYWTVYDTLVAARHATPVQLFFRPDC